MNLKTAGHLLQLKTFLFLLLFFPNALSSGEVIEEPFATDTFRLFVLHVGIEKVFALGLSQSNVPLVTTVLDDKYKGAQKLLKDGWYLMTNSPTTKKKKVIEQIAEAVGIWVKVEIV